MHYLHYGCAGEGVLDITTETGTIRHDVGIAMLGLTE